MLTALMDITEAEAGVMKLNLEKTSIASLLKNVVELYEVVAEEKHITITTDFKTPCEAVVDATRMRQAFANLLDNASNTHPKAATSVSVAPLNPPRDRAGARHWHGHPSRRATAHLGASLPRRQEPFPARPRLGLSLVKAIVEAHHGAVSVQSQPGEGSEFIVNIPQSELTI
jgi:K+-sensing histidine kinase KdpD